MERSKRFKTISTVITGGIFAYLVYLVIRLFVIYGSIADPDVKPEEDALMTVILAMCVPFLLLLVWAIIQRRYWWIPAVACMPLFAIVSAFGGVGEIIGLLGVIIVPFICCMIMIWTIRDDDDCVPEYKEYQYYGQDLW